MASPKRITIKETIPELRALQRGSGHLISKRLAVLIECKRHEKTGISKTELSAITGVNHNSVVKWRNMYEAGGMERMLRHGRIGFKKSILTKEEHGQLEKKLHDPTNGINGYAALLNWVKRELGKDMLYITLLKYTQRHFGAKIKVARKSHVKKDKAAVAAFKKTSPRNARS
jgi:transposase